MYRITTNDIKVIKILQMHLNILFDPCQYLNKHAGMSASLNMNNLGLCIFHMMITLSFWYMCVLLSTVLLILDTYQLSSAALSR